MARPRKYNDEKRAEIIAAIEVEYGGNVHAACKALGIPVSTVLRWYDPPLRRRTLNKKHVVVAPMPSLPSQELIDTKRMQMTDIFESIVAKYALFLNHADLDNVRPNNAAVVLGILFDKLQIMRGQPTNITQTNVRYMEEGSLRKMAQARLKVLEGGKSGPDQNGEREPEAPEGTKRGATG